MNLPFPSRQMQVRSSKRMTVWGNILRRQLSLYFASLVSLRCTATSSAWLASTSA